MRKSRRRWRAYDVVALATSALFTTHARAATRNWDGSVPSSRFRRAEHPAAAAAACRRPTGDESRFAIASTFSVARGAYHTTPVARSASAIRARQRPPQGNCM